MLKTVLLLITVTSFAPWSIFMAKSFDAFPGRVIPAERDATTITNSNALHPFFKQLAAFEARRRVRPLRIVQYGDSHTKADFFTGAVRKSLVRDFVGITPTLVKKTSYKHSSADGQGIVYQPLGINGARAKRLRDMTQSESFLESVSENTPDLIVIAYGSNEVTDGDWTVDSYSHMLVRIITRLRSASPYASFLIIGPPDRSVFSAGEWTSAGRMRQLLEAQQKAAVLAGAAFWSQYDAMGGAGSMNAWVAQGLARFDHVHLTVAGYEKLARLFFNDLMSAYRKGQPLADGPIKGVDLRVMRGVPVTTKR